MEQANLKCWQIFCVIFFYCE